MEFLIILILFAAVLILAVKSYLLKKQLRSIFYQLREEQTRLVTVEFVDEDMEKVVQEINTLLERIQQAVMKSNASSAVKDGRDHKDLFRTNTLLKCTDQ